MELHIFCARLHCRLMRERNAESTGGIPGLSAVSCCVISDVDVVKTERKGTPAADCSGSSYKVLFAL